MKTSYLIKSLITPNNVNSPCFQAYTLILLSPDANPQQILGSKLVVWELNNHPLPGTFPNNYYDRCTIIYHRNVVFFRVPCIMVIPPPPPPPPPPPQQQQQQQQQQK
jgi:hypothetical protein